MSTPGSSTLPAMVDGPFQPIALFAPIVPASSSASAAAAQHESTATTPSETAVPLNNAAAPVGAPQQKTPPPYQEDGICIAATPSPPPQHVTTISIASITTPPAPPKKVMTIHARIKRRGVNGGMDTKFITGEYPAGLHSLIPYNEFDNFVGEMNGALATHRTTTAENLMLGLGAITLVALVPFAVLRKKRAVKRKKATTAVLNAFNQKYPRLRAKITINGDLVIEDNPAVLYTGLALQPAPSAVASA